MAAGLMKILRKSR